MSFKCEVCGKQQKSGSKPEIIVAGKRPKEYAARYSIDGKTLDKGGTGWEITGEKKVCKSCFNRLEKKEPVTT